MAVSDLKEIFEKYPITVSGVGDAIGHDRVWLAQRLSGYRNWQPGDLEKIQEYLNEIGKELSKVKLVKKKSPIRYYLDRANQTMKKD